MSSAVRPSHNTAISPVRSTAVPHVAAWDVEASWIWSAGAAGLTILALGLRLFQIDRESLWLDEGYTLFFSQLPLKQLLLIGGAHEHPPLYYLIVHFLLSLHSSFLVTRCVSAVAGALCVLAIYALGRRMFSPSAGITAAALLTFSPFQVWWSRDGRAYELAGLLVLLSYLSALHALDRPSRRMWIAYSVCTVLALYTEYITAFVLLPQALLLLKARAHGLQRPLLSSWMLAALLFAPWLTVLSRDAISVAADYWIPMPNWNILQNTVLEFLGLVTPCPNFPCVGPGASLPITAGHESWIAATAIGGVLVAGAYSLLIRRLEILIAVLWLILPFVIVLTLAVKRSLYVDRVFLDSTFALYLLLGASVTAGLRRWKVIVAVLCVAWIGIGGMANLRLVYSQQSNPDWQALAHDLQAAYRPGQAIIYNPAVLRTLVSAYLPHDWHATREQLLWFHGYLDVPGWQKKYGSLREAVVNDSRITPQLRYGRFDTILRDVQLQHVTAGQDKVWLVTQDYSGVTDSRRWLGVHDFHLLLSEIYHGDARLELWARGDPRSVGPRVLGPSLANGWTKFGIVTTGPTGEATEQGSASLTRTFPVHPGRVYVVNSEYRGLPGSHPSIRIRVYDAYGRALGRMIDRFGGVIDSFPRTEWYDMPVNDVWLSQPFGFVAPVGAVRATITAGNAAGTCLWRNIAIYRQ